jgi:hypothetical protein
LSFLLAVADGLPGGFADDAFADPYALWGVVAAKPAVDNGGQVTSGD